MDPARALEIIQSLAAGIDPLTGENFKSSSSLQNIEVVRALFIAAAALQDLPKETKPSKIKDAALPAAAGKPWTEKEDQQLAAAFDGGATEKDLALKHQRTRGAIRARLVRLGKVDPGAYERHQPARSPAISEPRVSH